MASVNKAIIVGNLGKDPDVRHMPTGDCVCSFSIATTDKWTDKATGEKREATEWHNIVIFKKLAEIAVQYLKKGASVYIEGKLKTEKYTDKNGIERYTTKIVADTMQMLGSKDRADNQQQEFADESPKTSPQAKQSKDTDFDGMSEEIPF